MKIPNLVQALRDRVEKQRKKTKEKKGTKNLFEKRIVQALTNPAERVRFTSLMKNKGLTASDLMTLSRDLTFSKSKTNEYLDDRVAKYGFIKLSDVKDKGERFLKILVLVRDEYAPDIADHVTFKDAAWGVIDQVIGPLPPP